MENLFDLDFNRWGIILFSIIPALINIGIFLYVSALLSCSKTNSTFSVFVMLVGLWQLADGLMRMSITARTAFEWNIVSNVFESFVFPFGILFTLYFSGWYKKVSNSFVFTILFLPAIIFLFFVSARLDKYSIIRSDYWYWIADPEPTIVNYVLYAWFALGALFMLTLLWMYYRKIKTDTIKRKQSFLLAVGFSVPVIVGIIVETIFPLIERLDDIPLTTPLFTIFSIASLLAIKKYKLLDYSPKHQWNQIVEAISEGLIIVNNQDEIMYTNKMFCELLGYEFEEIKEKRAVDLFSNNSKKEQQIENLTEDKKNNRSGEYEIELKTKFGEILWVIMSNAPYKDGNGEIIGTISILTNITERKKAEEEIKKLNEGLEERVKERTSELAQANTLLEKETQIVLKTNKIVAQKNKDITDSLNYAKLIQNAIVHKTETLERLLPQSFVFNMPYNIVSGDFVRVDEKNGKILVALADCTGHGIPGAMMSMIGCTLFNEIINYKQKTDPSVILELLDSSFKELTKEAAAINDGMDVGFCSIDLDNMKLNYTGAHRPLYIIRNSILTEIKGDNLYIGGHMGDKKKFTNHHLQLQKNDMIYMFSDGYVDQFGGENGKKFSTKRFKEMLISIQHLNMEEQGDYLKKAIIEWKGGLEQVDDISVLGFRI